VSTISTDSALTRLLLAVYARFKSVKFKKILQTKKNYNFGGAPTGGGPGAMAPWIPLNPALLDWLLKTEEDNIGYEQLKMLAQDRSSWHL